MKYELYGSTTSPYVRKLRMYLMSQNVSFELKPLNYFANPEDAEFLKKHNPINKIPFLVMINPETETRSESSGVARQAQTLFDSRVIFNYFQHKLGRPNMTLDDENRLSAVDALLETSVNLFSLKRGGMDLNHSGNSYVEKQKDRLELILKWLEPWINDLNQHTPGHPVSQNWNYPVMSLYAFADWAFFRDVIKAESHPMLSRFHVIHQNHPHVHDTRIIV